MKPIAIHNQSLGFTERWIEYCERKNIPFIEVNCFDNNIIDILSNCSALLWHWNYDKYPDSQIAKGLIFSLEKMGIKTLPDYSSCWHFDNKISQKYLLESIKAPIANTNIFFDMNSAIGWCQNANFPIVGKLKTGAGSQNVFLIKDQKSALTIIKKSFSSGFFTQNYRNIIKDRFNKLTKYPNIENFKKLIIILSKTLRKPINTKYIEKERGYVYFQEFLGSNPFDTRLIVIGGRCFAIRRYNREHDFRASGSGILEYTPDIFDINAVKIAFKVADSLNSRSIALDFLYDNNNNPVITEISYAFPTGSFTDNCPGYWDKNLNFIKGKFIVQHLMIEDLLAEIV